jgi:hypothetical protein
MKKNQLKMRKRRKTNKMEWMNTIDLLYRQGENSNLFLAIAES